MENLRLTKKEQEAIRAKSIEINKKLIEKNIQPMKESEIIHSILGYCIKNIRISKDGTLYVDI